MATNNFKPFATGTGANVTAQADYEALSALLTGFASGKASSAQVNKALRQSTFVAAALAQFILNKSAIDVLDDGDLAGFVTDLGNALNKHSQPLDAGLTSLAALVGGANVLPYYTAADVFAQTSLTAIGRSLIGQTTQASALSYLGGAPLASPTFTGTPAAPTAAAGTNTTQLANTAWVNSAITTAFSPLAPLASPALTGTPTAPTAASSTNNTQIATTAFVATALTALLPKRTFSARDYIRIPDVPGGLIIQFGLESVPASSATIFNLATAFPNAALCAIASAADSTTTTNYRASTGSPTFPTKSQITLVNNWSGNAINVNYIAIGY